MKKIIEFEIENGEFILVEVEDSFAEGGNTYVSHGVEIERASNKFTKSLDSIKLIAKASIDKVTSLPRKPDEFSMEFGLKFSGKANAILVSGESEANIKVTLTWKNKEKADGPNI